MAKIVSIASLTKARSSLPYKLNIFPRAFPFYSEEKATVWTQQ